MRITPLKIQVLLLLTLWMIPGYLNPQDRETRNFLFV